jgi:hypothetical protein
LIVSCETLIRPRLTRILTISDVVPTAFLGAALRLLAGLKALREQC